VAAQTTGECLHSFRQRLERRVHDWLASEEAREFPAAALYAHLPELFMALAGVALDGRVPTRERSAVLSALKYIVAPFDLIPEGVVGPSGFRDDLVLAAMVVDHLSCRGFANVLGEHWEGKGDPLAVAREILEAGEALVGAEICHRLHQWLPEEG